MQQLQDEAWKIIESESFFGYFRMTSDSQDEISNFSLRSASRYME